MNNSIISILLGSCLKMIDDHHDMGLYNKKIITFVKILLTLLTIYWVNMDFEYCVALVIVCVVCYMFKQIDIPYYKNMMGLITIIFLYQFNTNTLNTTKMYELFITFILLFVGVYIEDKVFQKDYSLFKLESRCVGFVIMSIYLYFYIYNNNTIQNIFDLDNPISKLIKIIDPDINAILVVFGYLFISTIDMTYKLKNDNII